MNRTVKATTTASLLMLTLSGGAMAAQQDGQFLIRMNVQGQSEVPSWDPINYLYDPWGNQGAPYGCSVWSPDVSTIDWGNDFQQSRNCSQDQVRTATPVLFNSVLQTTKLGEPFEESRTVNVAQFQPAVGKRDYIDGESAKSWSAWTDVGGHHSCTDWTPETDTVNLYDDFSQTRDCQQDQTRSRDVYHVWASGKETPKRVDTEEQTITEQEQRTTQGTRDYIYGERIGGWTIWSNTGSPYACTSWTPTPDTVNLDTNFTQTRDCQQDQDSERNIYDVWRSGKETLNRVEPRNQTITVEQSRSAVGEKDFIASERIGEWTTWTDEGGHFACETWSPDVSTVNYGESFTQTRDCSQKQVRERNVYNVWQSGKETLKRVDDQSQTLTEQEQKSAVGTKDYITGESIKSWSAWSDDGAYYGCSNWSPAVDTVNLEQSFTQSRTCSQDQTRTRQVMNTWASGKETFKRTETGSQTIDDNQSRSATGTKDYITGTSAGSWSGWSSSGGQYSCSSWGPSTGTVNWGVSFIQSQSCSQNQTRNRTIYNVWKSGKRTAKTTESGSQTISVTNERQAEGTKDYITSTTYSSWSSWSTTRSRYNCTSYSPSTGTVNWGQSFTQTRDCDRDQERTRTVYKNWASGNRTTAGTQTDDRTITITDSRGATGTKDYVTGQSYGSWSSWSNTSGYYNCTAWSPSPSTVTYGQRFTQTRTCSVNQERTRSVYNEWASGDSTLAYTQTDTQSTTVGGAKYNTGTKNVITDSQTSYSSWSTSGSASCGSYSPSPSTVNLGQSFTQKRTCYQDYTRTKTVRNVWSDGSTTVASSTTESKTESYQQSRGATGTKDYIVTYDHKVRYYTYSSWSCDMWSPSRESVSETRRFTQSRDCSRTKYYRYDRYAEYKSGKLVLQASGVVSSSSVESKRETREVYGTKPGMCGDYHC